jgi:hypothetical protein
MMHGEEEAKRRIVELAAMTTVMNYDDNWLDDLLTAVARGDTSEVDRLLLLGGDGR